MKKSRFFRRYRLVITNQYEHGTETCEKSGIKWKEVQSTINFFRSVPPNPIFGKLISSRTECYVGNIFTQEGDWERVEMTSMY